MPMAAVGYNPPLSGSDVGIVATSRRIAAAAIGVAEENLVGDVFNIGFFGEAPGAVAIAGSGTRGGLVQKQRINTGVTGSSHSAVGPTLLLSPTSPKILAIGATKRWWVGGIYALSLTPPIAAGDAGGIIMNENTVGFLGHVGFHATASVNNFGVNIQGGSGGSIDSGVPIDALARFHEFWRDGNTGNYRVNLATNFRGSLGAPTQGNIRPSVISTICAGMQIAAGAVDLLGDFEWIGAWAERE